MAKDKNIGQNQVILSSFLNYKYDDVLLEVEKLKEKYPNHNILIDWFNSNFIAEGKDKIDLDIEKMQKIIDAYKKNLLSQLKKVGA